MYDEGGPPPSCPCLNAIPKLMFNQFTNVREAKANTLLRDGGQYHVKKFAIGTHIVSSCN